MSKTKTRFSRLLRSGVLALASVLACASAAQTAWAGYTYVPAGTIPQSALIQPAALVAMLTGPAAARPLVLQVGARVLYRQAHIRGSEYVGPGEDDAGIEALRARIAKLRRDAPIVLYCGCCPWDHCRNIGGAYAALVRLGFMHVKVLYLESNFGSNWVDQGYPVATGD